MSNENVEGFIRGGVFYLKVVGFDFEAKHRWMKIYLTMAIFSMCFVVTGQVVFIVKSDIDLHQKTAQTSYLNYYLVGILKVMALLCNRKVILKAFNEFRRIYPAAQVEKTYNLRIYLKQYLLIEKFLLVFLYVIVILYESTPLALSFKEFIKNGHFPLNTPLFLWYPIGIRNSWPLYVFEYFIQVFSTCISTTVSLSLDLCLFGFLMQLCMHFDIIQRNIQRIEPHEGAAAEKRIKEQIVYHELMLRLSDVVNTVFIPSVLFSLLSSSLILCFTAYQLLGDTSLVMAFKSVLLLGFEMKQVAITCFLGDKLSENSAKIADAIYEHKWYEGTPRYRRLVLLVILRSQRCAGLRVMGISDVTRQTLRRVMSISYQIFTVLKTRESRFWD